MERNYFSHYFNAQQGPQSFKFAFPNLHNLLFMKAAFISLLFILVTISSSAQEIVFITQPAANKVGIQDAFEVKYILKNASQVQKFSLPESNDIQVVNGPSQSNNTMITNGEVSVTIELTYVFRAKHKGTIVVPGGIAYGGNKEFRSNSVTIEVVDGSVAPQRNQQRGGNPFGNDPFADDPFFAAIQKRQQQMMQQFQQSQAQAFGRQMPPQQQSMQQRPEVVGKKDIGNNMFIKVDVDKKKVSLGEQITATYKMYTRLPMEINLTKLPSLVGFWSQDFKIPQPPKPTRQIYNGKEYQVFEIKKTALFPTQTGTLQLDPAEAEGIARVLKPKQIKQQNPLQGAFDNDPFFKQFFGSMMMNDPNFDNSFITAYDYEDVPVKLKSSPISIEVTDVPNTNKPNSYDGAVGNYTLQSKIDKTELTTDDNANITLQIMGTGNLKIIGAPKIKFPEDIDAYDPVASDTITHTDNIIAGCKTFTYSFAPRIPGTFVIPPTSFSYYDPTSKQYKTLTTPTYTIHVKLGKNDNRVANNKLPKDIHDIQTSPIQLQVKHNTKWVFSPIYWGGFVLPFFAYIGLLFFKRKEEMLQSDIVLFKNKRANKIALKRLALAEKFLKQKNQNAFYEEASKAVWLYLSDKLNIPLALLSKELAEQKLSDKKIDMALQQELFRITNECEMALYSPESGVLKMQQTYGDAVQLIGKLEDGLV